MGEVTAFSKPGADLLGNRRFESISLQRGVWCEPHFLDQGGPLGFAPRAPSPNASTEKPPVPGLTRLGGEPHILASGHLREKGVTTDTDPNDPTRRCSRPTRRRIPAGRTWSRRARRSSTAQTT